MQIATTETLVARPLTRSEFASFWRRAVALVLDGILIRVISTIGGVAAPGIVETDLPIVSVLYSILFISFGATPAMQVLGMRVVDAERQPPGLVRSLRRYILPGLAELPLFFLFAGADMPIDTQIPIVLVGSLVILAISFLDPLWMIWDERKQTLHDKLGGTFVIRR